MNLRGLGQGVAASYFEHDNESSCTLREREFIDLLSNS
jgi:hypothetical protein